ncbi:hypothetical protein [Mycolicibacterium sp.]|uniref:DUF7257 domain-containing protein n=1 Tax=Mycolicibacterium sp. TaxID=2320850 RepID=UPI0025F605F1|nr:hypothetical protein [Mycolicibacterium sp.]
MSKIVYPAGPVTPHGCYHIRKGDDPMVSLMSPNGQVIFHLMGGLSIADPTRPECVQITELTGLIPPWESIEQQGATEDGSSFIDALYGPMDVTMKVTAIGRDAKHTRRVVRHLYEALDVKQTSDLSWMTHELGYWWAPVRWQMRPPDKYSSIKTKQPVTLQLRANSAFWQSYPDIDTFAFKYEATTDTFDYDRTVWRDLGENWPQHYDGNGGGYCYADGDRAVWRDDPDDTFTTQSRTVVNGPLKDFETETDNQVVSMVLGASPEWSMPESGCNDLWARMGRNEDGTWDGNGIRARITIGWVILSAFVDHVEVWRRTVYQFTPEHWLPIIPFIGDKWQLIAGYENDPRLFKIVCNGGTVLTYRETGTASHVGSAYRGIGFGMKAAGSLITQATPSTVRKVSAGDNSAATQSGFLERNNGGDQAAYDEYTLYGPATKFTIANGPGSTETIEFGPLAAGEIAHIRTDPRRKAVFDYTALTGAQTAPTLFGASPSDTMYRKLKGRFTSDCAIPPKQPGMRVQTYHVACSITGGNADSKIMAQLTPLRRYPQ